LVLWPLGVYTVIVILLVAAILAVSYVLGQRHSDREKFLPYEGGVAGVGSARLRVTPKFYLVAMLFVIFDLEVVFIFAWAIAARELGWPGYAGLMVFILILVAGLIYEWRMGALDWSAMRERRE
jgi:NADH-quinone oxidoreductase subunit A